MLEQQIVRKTKSAKDACRFLYNCPTSAKHSLLECISDYLNRHAGEILAGNRRDLHVARTNRLSSVLIDRLTLNAQRIEQMRRGVQDVITLPDPVGETFGHITRPNGLILERMRVPVGAVGIIYEARPNVTVDASVLCLKAGNAVVLRGGSEALHSNTALVKILTTALRDSGFPRGCVEFIDTTDRKAVQIMVKQDEHLDLIIPRGSQKLIRLIQSASSVPVIAHGEGNCHVFVDSPADLAMAEEIVFNAKVQRPSVCNAVEKLLVHEHVAASFLPSMIRRLQAAGVKVRGDRKSRAIVRGIDSANEKDWPREYLDLLIAVKVVRHLDEAIEHINHYGSHHSDSIVTSSPSHGERFLRAVDSAAVYVNASTRFTDGFEFGLGAEIGISTQKLHARGPMGLTELTTTKYVVRGNGQVRS